VNAAVTHGIGAAGRARAVLRQCERGFTLIELMVTLSIMAVLLTLVIPSFSAAFLSNKLAGYTNSWVASVQLARGEAVKRNLVVTLCRSADLATCATSGTWQQGWVVLSGTTLIQSHEALSADYHFTSSAYTISFQPSGVGATGTTLTLCRATPTAGAQERVVTLSTSGHTTVTTTRTGVCS
jgi:type IV fimbrial biogenesis protein FimT